MSPPKRAGFECFGLLLLICLGLQAQAQSGTSVSFYGNQTFQSNRAANGHRTVLINQAPKSCADLAWQSKIVFDESNTWLAMRARGQRRARSADLVFFQFRELNLKLPWDLRPEKNSSVYYDPFEMLGFYSAKAWEWGCKREELPWQAPWPFPQLGHDEKKGARIEAAGVHHSRFRYVERLDGWVTDVYYCARRLAEPEIEQLVLHLRQLQQGRREENSPHFKMFTNLREQLCGESSPQ